MCARTHTLSTHSRDTSMMLSKQQNAASSMEGDAWTMSFVNVEDMLLARNCRRRCYSILKTLRDKHLDFANSPITNYILKTLLLFECEKHPKESEWGEVDIGDRIIGRRSVHYTLTSRPVQASYCSWSAVYNAVAVRTTSFKQSICSGVNRRRCSNSRPSSRGNSCARSY